MWIMAAPAASHAAAVSAISSGVVGSCGHASFAVSAPVGATVTSRRSAGTVFSLTAGRLAPCVR